MRFQFTIARMLRSTAFFAVALATSMWLWRVASEPGTNDQLSGYGVFVVAGALGGAVGSLFGKAPMGVFLGCLSVIGLSIVLVLLAIIASLFFSLLVI